MLGCQVDQTIQRRGLRMMSEIRDAVPAQAGALMAQRRMLAACT